MNVSTSDSSSGCESGWTMYLNQSSYSQDHDISNHKNEDFIRYNKPRGNYSDGCDEQDEDLSMVSDASSGPPLFREDYEYCFDETKYIFYEEENTKVKNKGKEKKSGKKEYFYLNDTASSPINIKNHVAIHPRGASLEHKHIIRSKLASSHHLYQKNQIQELQVVCRIKSAYEDQLLEALRRF